MVIHYENGDTRIHALPKEQKRLSIRRKDSQKTTYAFTYSYMYVNTCLCIYVYSEGDTCAAFRSCQLLISAGVAQFIGPISYILVSFHIYYMNVCHVCSSRLGTSVKIWNILQNKP